MAVPWRDDARREDAGTISGVVGTATRRAGAVTLVSSLWTTSQFAACCINAARAGRSVLANSSTISHCVDAGSGVCRSAQLSLRTFWLFAREFSSFRRQGGGATKSGAGLGHGSARLPGDRAIRLSPAVASRRTGPRVPVVGCR